jgi:2'-5' RNA ligase
MKSPNFFFLLISPPPEVIDYVFYLKQLIARKIGHAYRSVHSTAHITLRQYYDFHNESLLYTFSERISQIKSFDIGIKNFDIFKENRTIFLNPYSTDLYDLSERINGHVIRPHITLATGLTLRDFEYIFEILNNKLYSVFFRCEYVTVLKSINGRWRFHMKLMLR